MYISIPISLYTYMYMYISIFIHIYVHVYIHTYILISALTSFVHEASWGQNYRALLQKRPIISRSLLTCILRSALISFVHRSVAKIALSFSKETSNLRLLFWKKTSNLRVLFSKETLNFHLFSEQTSTLQCVFVCTNWIVENFYCMLTISIGNSGQRAWPVSHEKFSKSSVVLILGWTMTTKLTFENFGTDSGVFVCTNCC